MTGSTRELSDTKIKQALSSVEVRELAEILVEAYEDGWRPPIYESSLDALYLKCLKLTASNTRYDPQTTASRNP